jgi:hypothetical protein
MIKKSKKEIEEAFDEIVDIRLKARSNRDVNTLEATEGQWKTLHKEYIQAVYESNSTVTTITDADKAIIKKSLERII